MFVFSLERYYCCYYPESEAFRERVASIVNYFRENGYNVIMDRMVSEEITSQGPTRWGENQIRRAKKVLIFLSPGLVNLALDGREDSQCQVQFVCLFLFGFFFFWFVLFLLPFFTLFLRKQRRRSSESARLPPMNFRIDSDQVPYHSRPQGRFSLLASRARPGARLW